MAVLVWRHGRSAAEAKRLMQQELSAAGYDEYVTWDGHQFSASVGFGAMLKIAGGVSDSHVVLDTCGGALAGTVLAKIREILQRRFPNGQV